MDKTREIADRLYKYVRDFNPATDRWISLTPNQVYQDGAIWELVEEGEQDDA